jgi:hypothetical protein
MYKIYFIEILVCRMYIYVCINTLVLSQVLNYQKENKNVRLTFVYFNDQF